MSEKDNTKLKPAEKNPWYVLATICDKWDKDDQDIIFNGRRLTNDRVWNSWIISRLDSEQKKVIDKNPPLAAYLMSVPNWTDIREQVERKFNKRLGIAFNNFEEPIFDKDDKWKRFEEPQITDEGDLINVNIDFSQTEFKKRLYLTFFIFPPFVQVVFNGSKFHQEVNLIQVKAYDIIIFDYAYFCDLAYFDDGLFESLYIRNATFNAQVELLHTVFEGLVNFNNCEFRMPCNFREVQFRKYYPDLANTIFREKITLSAKQNTKEITYWPDPPNCKQNPEAAKATCEILREQMESQGLHEQAHFFFRREMQFARKVGTFWQAIPNVVFGALSDYGHSILRPFIGLLSCWIIGALIYFGTTKLTFGGSMGLSVSNLLQITGLQRVYWSDVIECLPWGLKFLGGLQTLLAIPLLFLLLLGLRNRFRLK
jgi:hypothetical protein